MNLNLHVTKVEAVGLCPVVRAVRLVALFLPLILAASGAAQGLASTVAAPGVGAAVTGSLSGTVFDSTGAVVPEAAVTLANVRTGDVRNTQTDAAGTYSFTALPAGAFRLTVTGESFDPFTNSDITLGTGQTMQVAPVMLRLALVSAAVEVTASNHEVAEAQLKSEEQQRILGFLPNYYAVYYHPPAPLSAKQKMRLAFRSSIDPVNFAVSAAQAASETNSKDFQAYGTGAVGFAKRYGAAYADGFAGTMIGSGVMPALLHQDPRYYYKGTGSVASRVLYALSWTFRCKGDNGKWQPNYSFLLGDIAATGISDIYYPKAIRDEGGQTLEYGLFNLASQGVNALLQEFLFKKVTTHAHQPGE